MLLQAIAAITIGLVVVSLFPFVMLRPIILRSKRHPERRLPNRFSLADFLALFALVQIPLVIVNAADADLTRLGIIEKFLIPGGMAFAMVLLWLASVRAVNHAGICGQKRRFVTIALVFPLSVAGGLLTPVLIMAFIQLGELRIDNPWVIIFIFVYAIATVVLWFMIRWVLNEEYTPPETNIVEEPNPYQN